MTTFSQLVDDIIAESRRPDQRAEIVQFLNLTMLELHVDDQTGSAVLYGENRQETIVWPTVEDGYVWPLPVPHLYQNLDSVYYPEINRIPRMVNPGVGAALASEVDGAARYYRTGSNFAFFGYYSSSIALSWFERPRRLQYILPKERKVTWDEDAMTFVFAPGTLPAQETEILEQNTNWILQRWRDVLNSGAKAKLYVKLGDETRARLAYSLYQNARRGMMLTEMVTQAPYLER